MACLIGFLKNRRSCVSPAQGQVQIKCSTVLVKFNSNLFHREKVPLLLSIFFLGTSHNHASSLHPSDVNNPYMAWFFIRSMTKMFWALTFVAPKLSIPSTCLHWAGFLSLILLVLLWRTWLSGPSGFYYCYTASFWPANALARARASTAGKGCKPDVHDCSPSTRWTQDLCMHSSNHEEGIYMVTCCLCFQPPLVKAQIWRQKLHAHLLWPQNCVRTWSSPDSWLFVDRLFFFRVYWSFYLL